MVLPVEEKYMLQLTLGAHLPIQVLQITLKEIKMLSGIMVNENSTILLRQMIILYFRIGQTLDTTIQLIHQTALTEHHFSVQTAHSMESRIVEQDSTHMQFS